MPECSLWQGDCLDILSDPEAVRPGSVDLVYLDPPFNTARDYAMGSSGAVVFSDRWRWGETQEAGLEYLARVDAEVQHKAVMFVRNYTQGARDLSLRAYLMFLLPRLVACREVMKPDASIYLHCAPKVSHYLRLLMDWVFGADAFASEVIWKSSVGSRNDASGYGRGHDTILFYMRGDACFNPQLEPLTDKVKSEWYRYVDGDGRLYNVGNLTAPGGRGYQYEFLGVTRVWRYPLDRMNDLLREGRIVHRTTTPGSRRNVAGLRRYLDESKGRRPTDLWDDVKPLGRRSDERLEFPTQKPMRLLERIVASSSNAGDLVLDPFMGSGTSAVASVSLGRNYIGIDASEHAVEVSSGRLRDRGWQSQSGMR